MKIIVDENVPLADACFGHLGEVVRLPGRQMQRDDLAGAGALVVRSVTRVDQALLADTPVRFVGTCTIGVDHLDLRYLEQSGIAWASAPGSNANSVVEYVYAALAALNIDWLGLRVGIIGCGNVGGLLHRRLRAQGVTCHCYDPFLTPEQNPDLCELDEVLACDLICLHTPLTTDGPHPTRHMIGAARLRQLRPGAVLLNAGRGEVIDNRALRAHLEAGAELTVVLDVWEGEPNLDAVLLQRVALGTPHIAGYSYDGKIKGTEMIYRALCGHLGVTPQAPPAGALPEVVNSDLRLSGDNDDWSQLKALLPQVYDIAADDRRLRQLVIECGEDVQALARGFDRLRKTYPVRREFYNYRVLAKKGPLSQRLAAIGFRDKP